MKSTKTAPKQPARRRVPNGGDNKRITLTLEKRLYDAIKDDARDDLRTIAAYIRVLLLRHYGQEPVEKIEGVEHEAATCERVAPGNIT